MSTKYNVQHVYYGMLLSFHHLQQFLACEEHKELTHKYETTLAGKKEEKYELTLLSIFLDGNFTT